MYLGVDYYPEHWDLFMMDNDLERILKTGANTIRIGEFTWHMMETEEGKFDFSYFDLVIQKAKDHGLKVIFGTPTSTFPAWLAKRYPEILSKDEKGTTRAFGGRRQYCFNSDIYMKYAARITEQVVKHFAEEAAVVAWQMDNEIGHEGSDQCFCEKCHEKFQHFLNAKYGHIDILNKAYGTIFWGQTYNAFNEIPIPVPTITTHNPSLQLDWARFRSDSLNGYGNEMIRIVKEHKGEGQKITHNYFGGFFDRAYDQNVMSLNLDVVSYDNYPVWGGLDAPVSPAHIAMNHDYIRGLKKQNYWILEELMGAQGHTDIGYLPRPNQAQLWAYQAMAKGCEALLFFRWRTMSRGAEQHCQGILDVDNKDNRKLQEVTSFFKDIIDYEAVLKTPITSEVAIVYDYDNRWSWHYQPQSSGFNYTEEFLRLYQGFHNYNVSTDVIASSRSFEPYKVIVCPVMQVMDATFKERLEAFVELGGTVILTFRSGIKDRDNNLLFGETIPGYLSRLCGIEIQEFESLGEAKQVSMRGFGRLHEQSFNAGVWRDFIVPKGAEVLFKYADSPYDHYAAVTCNTYGKGNAYYVGCGIEATGIDAIVKRVISDLSLCYEETEQGIEVVYRGKEAERIRVVLNHNEVDSMYREVNLKPYEVLIERL